MADAPLLASRVTDWLASPDVIIALWLPIAFAAAATGFLRLLGGKAGGAIAAAGAAAGFILAYAGIVGARGVPMPFAAYKPLYLALAGLVIGALLDSSRPARGRRALIVVIGVGLLTWVGADAAFDSRPGPERNLVIAFLAAAALVFVRATRVSGSAVTVPVQLAVAAFGVAAVAVGQAPESAVHLGVALGATVVGFLLWNWPTYRFPPGAALVLGAGLPLLALAGELALYEDVNALALALLLLVFFSEWIAGQIRLGGSLSGKALRPVVLAFAGSLVVVAATLLARWQAGQPLPFLALFG